MNEVFYILIGIFTLYLIWIFLRLVDVLKNVKKGNKDQQEIKTRLTWLKEGINDIQRHLKKRKW